MPRNLDPRFTFDAFVVGPANRLAASAARKVAESPGAVYNPLFIYSGSGLGKTHLLGAIGHTIERMHSLPITYESTAELLELVARSAGPGPAAAPGPGAESIIEASHRLLQQQLGFSREVEGEPLDLSFDMGGVAHADTPEPAPAPAPASVLRAHLGDVSVLLLDDVQFLAGQREMQEELLRIWDSLAERGAQVVLTSDRAPPEIDDLDSRLLSRLSGGLIVDIGIPDFDTRVAIARRKARDRGVVLPPDTFRDLASNEFTNVRELQGALNRLIAVHEMEEREVEPPPPAPRAESPEAGVGDEFGDFLADVSGTVAEVAEQGVQRVADALLRWEGEGFRTRRLDQALGGAVDAAKAGEIVDLYERDARRLQAIAQEIRELDPQAAELSAEALRDPDRVEDAEALRDGVRERLRPPPAPPEGPGIEDLAGVGARVIRAARAVAEAPGRTYNPLYVRGSTEEARPLLVAVARALADRGLAVAFVDGTQLAEELVHAVERNRLDGWRDRYRRVDALVVAGLDQLTGLERGQDELFRFFEDLQARSRQLVFSARFPPQELALPTRLRSRLEAGLVVELDARDAEPSGDRPPAGERRPPAEAPRVRAGEPTDDAGSAAAGEEARARSAERRAAAEWIFSREKVLLEWPHDMDWIQQAPG